MTGEPPPAAPEPDHSASVEFLLRFEPDGPWCLTAIPPEGGQTATRTFTVDDDQQDVLAWLHRYRGENLYFTVNRPKGTPSKKPKKDDIAEFRWLHADVDPVGGADQLAAEQARIQALLLGDSPAGLPAATCVVFSGGGCGAFWRLSDPVAIRDRQHAEQDLELHNRHFIQALGSDKVAFNVDRIMRLPGTVNWPNEDKRKKGRVPTLARALLWRDAAHPLASFPKALPPAAPSAARSRQPSSNGHAPTTIEVEAFYEDAAHLPACVPDKLRLVIQHGHDPAEPERLPSRSEWQWWATCELVRVGLKDQEIAAIIADPKFAISGHVLSQKNVERYVLRQIERARDLAIDPVLEELNGKHAVICDAGGKCRILGEVVDSGIDRPRMSLQTFGDFHNRYSNRKVKVGENKHGPVLMPAGKWWTEHPRRRQFDTLTFAPGKDTRHAYNLWQGFAVEAREGDCSAFLSHLRQVACSDHDGHYRYLVRWMAHAVQKPGKPGQVAVVLKGEQGTGKGTIAKHFGALFGRHYLQVSNAAHLVGNFNDHLRDCVVLFGDEAFFAGDKRHESVLKTIITEDLLVIEKKGVDVEVSANCVHLLMASNNDWTVPAGLGDRRFFVLKVDDARKRDAKYFAALDAAMRAGGYEALLHYLQSLDLSDFDVRAKPDTEELGTEKKLSMNSMQSWWYHKLQEGQILPARDGWPEWVCCQELAEDFVSSQRKWGGDGRRSSQVTLGLFLRKVVPGTLTRRRSTGDHQYRNSQGFPETLSRPWGYLVPDVDACRAHWRARVDSNCTEWPEEEAPYERDPFPTPNQA